MLVDNGYAVVLELTGGIGSFLLYFIGIRIMGVGNVEIGTFVAFATYLTMFWNPIQNLSDFYSKLATNISAAERIFDILDTKAEVQDAPDAGELPAIEGKVRFEDAFAYSDEPETMVLKDVSFEINPGKPSLWWARPEQARQRLSILSVVSIILHPGTSMWMIMTWRRLRSTV